MKPTYRSLYQEIRMGLARLIHEHPVGPYQIETAFIQRSDGTLWMAQNMNHEPPAERMLSDESVPFVKLHEELEMVG